MASCTRARVACIVATAAICAIGGAMVACQSVSSQSHGSTLADSTLPAVSCEQGVYTPFQLSPLGFRPAAGVIVFPGIPAAQSAQVASPSPNEFIRLDYCLDEEDDSRSRLKQIVYKASLLARVVTVAVPDTAQVNGLMASVFSGNYENLHILVSIKHDMPGDNFDFEEVLRIDGWQDAARQFATFSQMTIDARGSRLGKPLLAGKIVYGDPILVGTCNLDDVAGVADFTLDTAHFSFDLCMSRGTGRTSLYRIRGLSVVDNSPALSESARTMQLFKDITLSAAGGTEGGTGTADLGSGQTFTYRVNHHNSCDSFILKLAAATYAVSGPNAVGHCTALDGAPEPMPIGPGAAVKYRFAYGTAVHDGVEQGCNHYVLNCPQH